MTKEKRNAKIIFNKSGGNAGGGALTTRVTIPSLWARNMELMPDDRDIIIEYNDEDQAITIRKKKNSTE